MREHPSDEHGRQDDDDEGDVLNERGRLQVAQGLEFQVPRHPPEVTTNSFGEHLARPHAAMILSDVRARQPCQY